MIVVTGATGNIGRPLVAALASAGEHVTAVSRNPSAQAPAPGVRQYRADLAEPAALTPALQGADALFLLVTGPLLVGGAHPRELVEVVRASGVGRVVLLSSQAAGTRPHLASHAGPRAYEAGLRNIGGDWTVLRPGGFFTNSLQWAESVRARRTVAAPFGDVGLPYLDPADIASVAAAVLREPGHAGRTYELTGPAPITPRQQARDIGAALGTPVRFVEQSRAEALLELLRFMPDPIAHGTLDILGAPTEAERQVSPDVEKILGRAPGTYADWVARRAAAFA